MSTYEEMVEQGAQALIDREMHWSQRRLADLDYDARKLWESHARAVLEAAGVQELIEREAMSHRHIRKIAAFLAIRGITWDMIGETIVDYATRLEQGVPTDAETQAVIQGYWTDEIERTAAAEAERDALQVRVAELKGMLRDAYSLLMRPENHCQDWHADRAAWAIRLPPAFLSGDTRSPLTSVSDGSNSDQGDGTP